MKKTLTVFVFIASTLVVNAQTIYSKAFGNPSDKPIIYLHGGPGYNSIGFEVSTAQTLSDNGFYVIVYDRRGEGRSADLNGKFTFQETFDDLTDLYKKYGLKNASLIGHSFGGIVGTLFAEKYPKKVKSLLLAAAPLSMQETLLNIINTSKVIYETNNDSTNLMYITMLEKMDKTTLQYSSYSFGHAMQNGFYSPKAPTKEALAIYKNLKTDSTFAGKGTVMTYEPPKGFWKNESYTSIDITENLKNVQNKEIPIFGIYGTEDGLYSEEQVMALEKLVKADNFKHLLNCSHNVFIDQQSQFITALRNWIK